MAVDLGSLRVQPHDQITTAHNRFGRTLRAVRDDEVAAALAGIHIGRTKIFAFLLSAACGGLAGGLQAFLLGTAAPGSFTVALSLSLLDLGTNITQNLPLAVFGTVLIAVVLVFPRGIHGALARLARSSRKGRP